MEVIELIPAAKIAKKTKDVLAERKAKNWQKTLESINRNAEAGNSHGWSDICLSLEECEKLETAGYKVIYCAVNDCHEIRW